MKGYIHTKLYHDTIVNTKKTIKEVQALHVWTTVLLPPGPGGRVRADEKLRE